VSQLKKQNREMRSDIEARDGVIDKLKKDLKMSKSTELEVEMQ